MASTHLVLEVLVDLAGPHHVAQQHDLGRRARDDSTLQRGRRSEAVLSWPSPLCTGR